MGRVTAVLGVGMGIRCLKHATCRNPAMRRMSMCMSKLPSVCLCARHVGAFGPIRWDCGGQTND